MKLVFAKAIPSGRVCHLVNDEGYGVDMANKYSATGFGDTDEEAKADLLKTMNYNLEKSYKSDVQKLNAAVLLARE